MSGKTSFAQGQLRALIERIERLEEEKAAIAADIKEVYSEAKANGFDTKILRKVVSLRKKDAQERAEEEAMMDVYLSSLGMQSSLFDEPSSTAVDETEPEESGSGAHTATGAPAAPIASSDTERASTGAGKPLTDETSDPGSVSAGSIAGKSDDLAEIQPRPVPESAADMVEGAVIPVSVPSTDYSDMGDIPAFLDRRKGSGDTTGKATPTSGVISGLSCLPAHDAGAVS